MKKVKLCIDTINFLKIIDKITYKVDINQENIKKIFEIFKVFTSENKTKLTVSAYNIPKLKDKDTLLNKVLENKNTLVKCDANYEGLKYLTNTTDVYNWIVDNHTKVSFFKHINLRRDVYSIHPKCNIDLLNKLLYDNPFVPINAITCLEINDLEYRKASLNGVYIHCFEKINDNTPKIDLDEVYRITEIMRKLTNKTDKKIVLVFGLTNYKKKIPKEHIGINKLIVFKPIYINSGSSYRGNYINIWRKEEFYKVLIHELIHFLEIDIKYIIDSQKIESYLKKHIHIDGACHPCEIYTESLTVILYTIYNYSKLTDISDFNNKDFCKLLEIEIKFSLLQVDKILKITGSTIDNMFIKQTTDVACYFIFKTAILMEINSFIKLFLNYGLDFCSRVDIFINLLNSGLIKLKNELKNITINGSSEMQSMRMTCLDIENIN